MFTSASIRKQVVSIGRRGKAIKKEMSHPRPKDENTQGLENDRDLVTIKVYKKTMRLLRKLKRRISLDEREPSNAKLIEAISEQAAKEGRVILPEDVKTPLDRKVIEAMSEFASASLTAPERTFIRHFFPAVSDSDWDELKKKKPKS